MPRTIFVWSCIAVFTLVLGVMSFLTFPFDRRGKAVHLYARLWGWLILLANGVKVRVRGLGNIESKRPYIYMCNHLGSFDIFALLAYLPVQFRWLAKVELFRIPILGWAMSTAGYISLDRSERKRAYRSIEIAAQKIREGTSVIIFPEGSRSLDGTLQPFMKGGFTLAIKAGVPIVPTTIDGTWEIMPRDSLRIRKGEIGIVIDRPIETTGLAMKNREKLMKDVEERIRANFPVMVREHRDVA
ncbi:MAG: 1-acyl-sn-glycerol-3-phosphate acyltransferase [Deltaproteobacteria bacterium]|nr:MAG: 1-acyl-sn-glycerol-3-phosphate acyltransferase [Deltaproteobacteria bacterium]